MKTKINYKKAMIAGVIVLLIDMIVGNLLYMNPIVSKIFEEYKGHPTMKPMEAFGGMGNWILINASFSIFLIIIFMAIYLLLYQGIPGTGWRKGLSFGLLLGIIKAIPEAFNQWMLFNYPSILIIVQMINTIVSLIIFGIVLSLIFNKFQVIQEIQEAA